MGFWKFPVCFSHFVWPPKGKRRFDLFQKIHLSEIRQGFLLGASQRVHMGVREAPRRDDGGGRAAPRGIARLVLCVRPDGPWRHLDRSCRNSVASRLDARPASLRVACAARSACGGCRRFVPAARDSPLACVAPLSYPIPSTRRRRHKRVLEVEEVSSGRNGGRGAKSDTNLSLYSRQHS